MQRLEVELSAIPDEGLCCEFRSSGQTLGINDPALAVVQPIEIGCRFFTVARDVVVQGTMRSALRLTCVRCAEDFVLPLNVVLNAVYLPIQEASSERAKELEEDVDSATDVYSYVEQVIDIAEMARDKLLLSSPLQPHCMVGCQVLCPACGLNRNIVSCQCAEEKLGSPFELLKDLRFS
jgi:uncharacterized metal-binding protein YceD (DUF177 family)